MARPRIITIGYILVSDANLLFVRKKTNKKKRKKLFGSDPNPSL